MKIIFKPTEYHSDMESFRVSRGRGFRWIASIRSGHQWEVLADDCASAEAAMDVCTEHLRAFAEKPANDVEF